MATVLAALSAAASLVACDAIIGTKDRYFSDTEPDASGELPDATSDAAPGSDAQLPVDAAPDRDGSGDAGADSAVDSGPVDPDLVASWTFDEDGGVVAHDGTGHGNDLLLSNGASVGGEGYFGTGALEIPMATGEAASVALSGAGFPLAGTLSMWCFFVTPATDLQAGIFDYYDETRHHFYVRYTEGNRQSSTTFELDDTLEDGANYDFFASPKPLLTTGRWTHFVLVWDTTIGPATAQFYVDDLLPPQAQEMYNFGSGPLDQNFVLSNGFTGLYDDIYLWKRPFSAVEVATLPSK